MKIDFVTLIDTLEKGKYPFAVYRFPEEKTVNIIIDDSPQLNVLKDPDTEKGFVFAPFDNKVPAVFIRPAVLTAMPTSDLPMVDLSSQTEPLADQIIQRENYISLVKKAMVEINEGDIKKIVTSRRQDVEYTDINTAGVFSAMVSKYTDAMVYYFSHPQIGRWIGASPELLLFKRAEKLHTMALAGTMPYVGETNYRWGKKEVEEQALVTLFINDTLEANGVKDIRISKPENHRAGSVVHLCTEITGNSSADTNTQKLLSQLSPTPALSGYPKESAMEFLKKNEKHHREFYGGYIGEINMSGEHSAELYVNIRCMQIKDDVISLYAGGGITAQSVPDDEWEETVQKMQTMESVLAPFIVR
ncbi:MAG: chorismate-binding protein [Flavobacteriales bacterium]|nr:chorismate-binding protein [Flavobacteriales bacterium]